MDKDPEALAIKEAQERVDTAWLSLQGAERDLQRAVDQARRVGWTWATVGDCIGVSRQAAQQRFGG
jgi:hypothetical protein